LKNIQMDKKFKTQSDVIVAYLEQIGVKYVFGIPGGHISSLYESLHRSEKRGGPSAVMNRHETGAAYMASAYARETGNIGVCFVTAGPGATNIITGAAEANANHEPLLIITGQTLLNASGRGALQECSPYPGPFPDIADTLGMLEHCTCYNSSVSHIGQLENKLSAALISAMQPPRGVAHLGIPVDILRAPGPDSAAYPDLARLLARTSPSYFADLPALEELWEAVYDTLRRGRRLALFIGYECAGAVEEIMTFAEMTNTQMVSSQRGRCRINPYHPLFQGVFGLSGHKTARRVLADESTDLILAVGTNLGQLGTALWHPLLFNHKMVHIHHANIYFPRSPMARLHVCGTIKLIFRELITRLENAQEKGKLHLHKPANMKPPGFARGNGENYQPPCQIELDSPNAYHSDSVPMKPQRLIYELMQHFPAQTRYLGDTGTAFDWILHYLFLPNPENCRVVSGMQAPMGWAAGSAVGAALALPDTPVVCLIGDGSYLMYGHEIAVAVEEKLPVIFVVLNDRSFGAVKHRNRRIGTINLAFALSPTDFSLMAKAVGADGYVIRSPEDFGKLDYQAMCRRPGPTVLDVHIDPDEAPPIDQ